MTVRSRNSFFGILFFAALSLLLPAKSLEAQTYSKGQPVWPAYEGWEQEADGSRYFVFGYMNENWEEEVDVPIGPDNSIEPGGVDQGQPTHFLPRRNRFTFRIPVPSGFSEKDEIVWTLTTRGKQNRAYASLRTDYFLDPTAKASEIGALGGGFSTPDVRANTAPTLKVEGGRTLNARVGEPVTFVAWSTDDGQPAKGLAEFYNTQRPIPSATPKGLPPPPQQITVNSVSGLWVSWFVYRGAANVLFDPMPVKVWEDSRVGANSPWAPKWTAPTPPADGKFVTRATFTKPGTYVLRCRAFDGAMSTDVDVTVNVTP